MPQCSCNDSTSIYTGMCKQCKSPCNTPMTRLMRNILCEQHGTNTVHFNEIDLCASCRETHNVNMTTGKIHMRACTCDTIQEIDYTCPICEKKWIDDMPQHYKVGKCTVHQKDSVFIGTCSPSLNHCSSVCDYCMEHTVNK